jgi:DNA replication protein DnaC
MEKQKTSMKEKLKEVNWIFGDGSYGKTYFVKSIIKDFERDGKSVHRTSGKEILNLTVRKKIEERIEIILNLQKYDLLVIDDIDVGLITLAASGQFFFDEILANIVKSNKTKVLLVSRKKPNEFSYPKNNNFFYLRFKKPSLKRKRRLLEKWLKENHVLISENEKEKIIRKNDTITGIKGEVNKLTLLKKITA